MVNTRKSSEDSKAATAAAKALQAQLQAQAALPQHTEPEAAALHGNSSSSNSGRNIASASKESFMTPPRLVVATAISGDQFTAAVGDQIEASRQITVEGRRLDLREQDCKGIGANRQARP